MLATPIIRFVFLFTSIAVFSSLVACSRTGEPGVSAVNHSTVPLGDEGNPSLTTPQPETASAPATSKIIFVLDASGSMWGKVGNEEKIVSAKRVLKDAIGKLPDDTQVGLIAYGHRSKSDCADIETIAPLGPLDRGGLAAKIDALDPKGKTPITDSLRKAIAEVKAMNLEETVKIVLISDGLETCTGDPCKLTREAREAGVKITVHVIGFDTGKLTVAQLECIAQAGGGLYLNADDAAGLGAALDQAVSIKPAEETNFLSVKAMSDGKLTDAMVRVTKSGGGEKVDSARTYESIDTNPRRIPLPVGKYDVTVEAIKIDGSPTITFEGVEIRENETVERIADFSAGVLKVRVTMNGQLHDASVQAFSQATKKLVASARTYTREAKSMRIIPGRYYVEITPLAVEGIETFTINDIIVKPGDKETLVEHNFETGILRVGSRQGSVLLDSTVTVADATTGQSIASGRTYVSATSNPRQFTIKPGTYRVTVQALKPRGLPSKEITVTVRPGETVERFVDY